MKEIKNVAIFGAGAMGAYYASRFFESSGFSTVLLARNPRHDRLKAEGLTVNGKHYSIPVVHPDETASPADLIIVALKNHHLPEAAHDLKNLVGEGTTLISVMNGLDSEEYLGSIYGMDKVLYAIAVGIDALRQGNEITYTNPGKIYFGESDNTIPNERVLNVRNAFERAGLASEIPADMMRMLWWKFMINVGINQASAVMRVPYGVFQTSPDAQKLMEMLMREVLALAHRLRVNLVEQDLNEWSKVLNSLSPQGKTSMLQDIEAGRKTEVESFAGKMVELGKIHGIPTPANEVVLSIIHVLEQTRA
ncbi:ketopantoate reductase family protein [Desulfomonile tiedjei]|uniref:2-dehydropantoate 2-reductase n=1 Tax=Desulfomonile tiedjei (strain ATCC 49306 / DSM 6799 / DCB-1) TaxID=706587 RepID=I4CCP5_DESTA|nr:2-dehydropantoate 2-reductase [Desulfomonile tiedjei]AFM27336.1 2-dehydropantoate 2-reductase [Desulfomonile tiedjei DSM 6799]